MQLLVTNGDRRGDLVELYQIFEQYQGDFLRFAKSLTHQEASAEDLVQQSYLKALDHMELLEVLHPNQVKGWFFSTIKRQFIDHWRAHGRREVHEGAMQEQLDTMIFDGIPGDSQWLETVSVRMALEALSPSERRLLVLKYAHGYSSQEIGQAMGINPSTVRNQLARARMAFIAHYDNEATKQSAI